MRLDQVLARLDRVRKCGAGYVARCPAHDDRHPSLSITPRAARIWIYCHGGCEFRDILDRLKIFARDLRLDDSSEAPAPVPREERIRLARVCGKNRNPRPVRL